MPGSLTAAIRAEFGRAVRPPYEVPLVVVANGLLVVLFWFSPFNSLVFTLHGALAFPLVLGSWMYSDVPSTNVIGSDRRRIAAALGDEPMLLRLLTAKAAVLWLMVAPLCMVIAVAIGVDTNRVSASLWTLGVIAFVPVGALALSAWVGILWPYEPISLRDRWRDRRQVRTQIRWLVLILVPYFAVPAAFVLVELPSMAWWRLDSDGTVSRIPAALFAKMTIVGAVTSIAVFFAAREVSRLLLRHRRNHLEAVLTDVRPGTVG